MRTSQSRLNQLRAKVKTIAARMAPTVSRIRAAKLAVLKLLGRVSEGAASYRRCCPTGAGAGPLKHSFEQKQQVGARKFFRRAQYLQKLYGQ